VPTLDFTHGIELCRRPRKTDPTLRQRLTFCGVTRWVEDWCKRAGIRPATVADRVQRQGMSPLAALSKPDAIGNFLRPLSPEGYDAEAKAYRKERTGVWGLGGGILGYRAVIETTRGNVDLGTYPTEPEAALALNTAMTLLPEGWQPEDHYSVDSPVPDAAASQIKQAVEDLVADLFPELPIGPNAEVDFARDQDTTEP
jgi:hypothetical protein